MKTVLSAALVFASWAAYAQGTGEVYAAPGMRVHLQQRLPAAPVKAAPTPVPVPMSPVLPRFWHRADSVMNEAARPFSKFTGAHLKYPANSLRAGISGKIYARLIILADGSVSQVRIIKRELVEEEGPGTSEPAKAALEAELVRVMRALRFEPSSAAKDSIDVTQGFAIQ